MASAADRTWGAKALEESHRTSLASGLSNWADGGISKEMQDTGEWTLQWSVPAPVGLQDECPLSPDRIPQILDVASELEFNLETMPRINCAAAGNPFPVRGSMELRKPDGTVLLVSLLTPNPGHPPHQLHS